MLLIGGSRRGRGGSPAGAGGRRGRGFRAALGDEARYGRAIERLRARCVESGTLWRPDADGVMPGHVVSDSCSVSRRLAREVPRGRYEPSVARARAIEVRGKRRTLYELACLDRVVHSAAGALLSEAVEADLPGCVYSYRRGRRPTDAVRAFASYVRAYRSGVADPRERGLYVLRRDVRSYTDTVRLDAASPLHGMLLGAVGEDGWSARFVADLLRPASCWEGVGEGTRWCRCVGMPTGSPLVVPIFNLYLRPLDDALLGLRGGFYARYSDDFLFAHPDAAVAAEASALIERTIAELSLSLGAVKGSDFYFNAAGRPSGGVLGLRGSAQARFLGCEIGFGGTVGLSAERATRLVERVAVRARRAAALAAQGGTGDRDGVGRAVCAAVNGAIEPWSAVQHAAARFALGCVTDRGQLRALDHRLSVVAAEALSGRRGVRALRAVPPREMRASWGLLSLERLRNRAARGPIAPGDRV